MAYIRLYGILLGLLCLIVLIAVRRVSKMGDEQARRIRRRWLIRRVPLVVAIAGILAIAGIVQVLLPDLACVQASAGKASLLSPPDLYAMACPAVVGIRLYDAEGAEYGRASGFFVSRDGHIATSHHVIEAAFAADAVLADGMQVPVLGLVAADEEADLALLQIGTRLTPFLRLADEDCPPVGSKVYVIRARGTHSSNIITDGLVTGAEDPTEQGMFSHSAATSFGTSGSPLLNSFGEVVGVHAAADTDADFMYFAAPVGKLRALLLNARPWPIPLDAYAATTRHAEPWTVKLVSAWFEATYSALSDLETAVLNLLRGKPEEE